MSTKYFSLERVAQAHAGDDIEELLILALDKQFQELWPSTLRPPTALNNLFVAVSTLIDWNGRTPRGKKNMRRRILKLIAALDDKAAFGPNDLATNANAQKVVPGILQALQEEDTIGLERDFSPSGAAELADEVETWLAAGDD